MRPHIRPASEWGATVELARAGHPMEATPKSLVVLHHTYRPHRPCGDRVSVEHGDLRGVDRYHRGKGWGGIGYHYAGFLSGNLYACRPFARTGAHTIGQNSKSIGYVLFIDGDVFNPTAAMIETFQDWLGWAVRTGILARDFIIRPHSDFAETSCPGIRVQAMIPDLRRPMMDPNTELRPVLVLNDHGDAVRALQQRLIELGYLRAGLATGLFGQHTAAAVRALQKQYGLLDDGIVGPRTWSVLVL